MNRIESVGATPNSPDRVIDLREFKAAVSRARGLDAGLREALLSFPDTMSMGRVGAGEGMGPTGPEGVARLSRFEFQVER